MTTYTGEGVQLAIAQQVLDEHVTSSVDGRCLKCGAPGPCYRRETAAVVFSRFRRLPRRIPGLTRPELVNARRVSIRPVTTASGREVVPMPRTSARRGRPVVGETR